MKKRDIKLNFYKSVWIFTIGALIGWAVELFIYWFKYDNFMYFQGLVYGPFQPVYGFGALLLAVMFIFLKNRGYLVTFLVGFIAFGIFEYFSSWLQEVLFDSFTWNYTNFFHLHLHGRVNLLYCIFFAILTVVWIKFIHEKLLVFLDKFKKKRWKIITILLAIFLVINIFLTCMVTVRFVNRYKEKQASNYLMKFIDEHYDDEFMKKWLPKVRVIPND